MRPKTVYQVKRRLKCENVDGCLEQITRRQEEDEKSSQLTEEWRALGNVIDRLMFVISVIILLSLCIWMMAKGSQQDVSQEEEDAEDSDH